MNLPVEPWLQLPHETDKAYAAFCIYRDLGPNRSIRKAFLSQLPVWRYTKQGRKRYCRLLSGRWVFWSRTYHWYRRAQVFDAHLGLKRIPAPLLRLLNEYCLGKHTAS